MQRLITHLALVLFLAPALSHAQEAEQLRARNAVYFEQLGNAYTPSINYERVLQGGQSSIRIGFSPFGEFEGQNPLERVFAPSSIDLSRSKITLLFSRLFRHGNGLDGPELGIGFTTSLDAVDEAFSRPIGMSTNFPFVATGLVGYRYQPADGGAVFRIGFTPFLGFLGWTPFAGEAGGVKPWGGLSLGYSF